VRIYNNGHIVIATGYKIRDVEFSLKVRASAHTNVFAVNIKLKITTYAFKHQIELFVRRNVEASVINSNRIFRKSVWRIKLERVVYVCVLDLAVTIAFPTRRDGKRFGVFDFSNGIGKIKRGREITKIPSTVKLTVLI
jgi:hypothetical protein